MVLQRLTVALIGVTGIHGLGLNVFDQLGIAVPIGASCDKTALSERLQFTVGEGLCHEAHRSGRAVVAIEPVMAPRWPAYPTSWSVKTLFRSVVALR